MKTVWDNQSSTGMQQIQTFSEAYRSFLSKAKTEREFVKDSTKLAEKAGFKELSSVKGTLKPGQKVYTINRGKNICLFVIGKKPIAQGLNILGAHIDSPRLDLKQHTLYEKDGLALFDTHYYGGIKKYQWVAHPMALHGVVCKKDGTTVSICFGEDPKEPVVEVSDLLIHLAQDQMKKTAAEAVTGENLNVLVGSIPSKNVEKDPVKAAILKLLKDRYKISEDDFMSAEIEVVPAGEARNCGLDNSMIMGYGHDDKVCAYTSLRAILDLKVVPERTACCILVDKEEIGSVGNTGMESRYFENTVTELLARQGKADYLTVQRTLTNCMMLSSDVSAAVDPNYEEVNEMKNAAFFGKGICFNKYTGSRGKGGSNDANPEYFAKIRKILDEDKVMFQTCELGAVDQGGGGTIAYILANLNMDVIDAGIAVQNMHAPYEVVSKADIYEGYRAYISFLKKMK